VYKPEGESGGASWDNRQASGQDELIHI